MDNVDQQSPFSPEGVRKLQEAVLERANNWRPGFSISVENFTDPNRRFAQLLITCNHSIFSEYGKWVSIACGKTVNSLITEKELMVKVDIHPYQLQNFCVLITVEGCTHVRF